MHEPPHPAPPQCALCVVIHDVAPANLRLCQCLVQAVQAVAPVPLTLLVVPQYHGLVNADSLAYTRWLEHRLAQGDELALHGLRHLDDGPAPTGLQQRWLRRIYTTGEGEFAALPATEAIRRIAIGRRWFAQRGWPLAGFVAPAWLMSAGSWQAVRRFPFAYTTTRTHFILLPQMQMITAPGLCYSTRNPAGRCLSRLWNTAQVARLKRLPLVRLGLHPKDARHPDLVRHFQALLGQLLELREPMTKAAFAARW